MEPIYNVELQDSRIQSGIGKAKILQQAPEEVNQLIVCKVLKVNYLYNTVDVVAKDKGDSYTKATETLGKYSARLPVNFGGALSNGMSYGQTLPINIGDEVLIGFVRGDLNAPIVVGIYKSGSVSRDLMPNPEDETYISGNPETPEKFDLLMTHGTIYPSQTYNIISGSGNVERTFAGKAFFKTSTNFEAQGSLNDYLYTYEDLDNATQRNGDPREPITLAVPTMLFQVPWRGISGGRTNIFLEDGLFRLSNMNLGARTNSILYMNRAGDIAFSYQTKDPDPDAGTIEGIESDVERNIMGIVGGIPTISIPNMKLEFKDGNMLLNGTTLQELISGYTHELEETIMELTTKITEILEVVNQINVEDLRALQQNVNNLLQRTSTLEDDVDEMDRALTLLQGSYNQFTSSFTTWQTQTDNGINALNTEIVDARGQKPNVNQRFIAVEDLVTSFGDRLTTAETNTNITDTTVMSNDNTVSCRVRIQGAIVNLIISGTSKDSTLIQLPEQATSPIQTGINQATRLLNKDTGKYVMGFVEITGTHVQIFSLEDVYPTNGYDIASTITYGKV